MNFFMDSSLIPSSKVGENMQPKTIVILPSNGILAVSLVPQRGQVSMVGECNDGILNFGSPVYS